MITLTKFNKSYYDTLISWIVSEEMLMQFAGPLFTFPLTYEQLDQSLSVTNRYAFSAFENEIMIGYAEIYLTEKAAHLGRIIVSEEMRGKRRGEQIVRKLLEIAFNKFNKCEASLNVFDWNIYAVKCYEKVGFQINPERNLERHVNGKKWIALNMILNKCDWTK
jgi:RimJ/RimL family protein N-acetyltransferase